MRWWAALHLVLAAAVVASGIPQWAAAAVLVGVVVHAVARRPKPHSCVLVCRSDGRFDLPDIGCRDLVLDARSVAARGYVRLVLTDGAAVLHVLLLRDQLDDPTWRRLLARLAAARG